MLMKRLLSKSGRDAEKVAATAIKPLPASFQFYTHRCYAKGSYTWSQATPPNRCPSCEEIVDSTDKVTRTGLVPVRSRYRIFEWP